MYKNIDINSIVYSYLDQNNEIFQKIINEKLSSLNVEVLIKELIQTKINRIIDHDLNYKISHIFEQTLEDKIIDRVKEKINEKFSKNFLDKEIQSAIKIFKIKKLLNAAIITKMKTDIENYKLSIVKVEKEYY